MYQLSPVQRARSLSTRQRWVALLVVLVAALACSEEPASEDAPKSEPATAGAVRGDPPNLLLITLDTTRADALGAYGQRRPVSPAIDALAKRGVLFEQVESSNPETLPSHATIFTGLWPFRHGVRSNSGYVVSPSNVTLAEILRARGYRTAAEVSARVLSARTQITQGFDEYRGAESPGVEIKEISYGDDHGGTRNTHTRIARDITRHGIEFIRRNAHRPFFLWLHYFSAHDPYFAPLRFNAVAPDSPYHAEVAHEDFEVGRVLQELDRLGLAGNTLVVVTADHGEDLGDHGEASHSFGIYETTMHVPLILAGLPRLTPGRRITQPARTIDIAPTILDLLGQPRSPGMAGVSLVPRLHDSSSEPALLAYAESTRYATTFGLPVVRFLRQGRWKYIHKSNPELYDLVTDPDERSNRIDEHPEIAADLRGKLEALLADSAEPPKDAASVVDDETAAELSVLGYMGHNTVALGAEGESLELWGEDPNLTLPDAARISEAQGLMLRRDSEGASKLVGPILERYPKSLRLLDMQATLQMDLHHPDLVADALHRILVIAPCDAKARANLVSLLRSQRQLAKSASVLAAAVDACPDDHEALNNYAWLLATSPDPSLRDGARAVALARKAIGAASPPPWAILDTLGCALAENGEFEEAAKTADEALSRARAEGAPEPTVKVLAQHAESFRQGKPVRETL